MEHNKKEFLARLKTLNKAIKNYKTDCLLRNRKRPRFLNDKGRAEVDIMRDAFEDFISHPERWTK